MEDQGPEKSPEGTFRVPQPVSSSGQANRGPMNGAYKPPTWDAIPEEINYTLDIIKSGTLLKSLPLSSYCKRSNKGWVSFGRVPDNDWPVEHPSTSRYHCILQFNGQRQIFVYDLGSTHGTFINKLRIQPGEYVELRVGDQMKIADSERIYVLNGPQDLMPAQGLSREEKRQALALEAYKKRKVEEEKRAIEQMTSALQSGGQAVADAVQVAMLSGAFDWRVYARDSGLTENQQKLANMLEKKERQMEALRKENERIQSKQEDMSYEGLTSGQSETLETNERKIEALLEQFEAIEEDLIESIRHSIEGKAGAKHFKRGEPDNLSDEDSASDEDAFYDRTGIQRKKKYRKTKQDASEAVGAKELVSQLEMLDREQQSLQNEMEEIKATLEDGEGQAQAAAVDELDTYLKTLDSSDTIHKIKILERKVQNLEQERAKAMNLLSIADPEGYYSRNRQQTPGKN